MSPLEKLLRNIFKTYDEIGDAENENERINLYKKIQLLNDVNIKVDLSEAIITACNILIFENEYKNIITRGKIIKNGIYIEFEVRSKNYYEPIHICIDEYGLYAYVPKRYSL